MIRPDLSRVILNKLFHTSGISGKPPSEEKQELISLGIPQGSFDGVGAEYGVKANLYAMEYQSSKGELSTEKTNEYDEWKAAVNRSQHWKAQEYSETIDYYWTGTDGKKVEGSRKFTGWYMVSKPQMLYYPTETYLALFTKMPDENGLNYEEPLKGADGTPTTYIRVNLHEAIISGEVCVTEAAPSPEGGSVVENKEIFVYPEVFGPTWGTIVGFGIMEKETVGTGDAAVHWQRLTQPLITRAERLPMFRVGCFKTVLR